MLARTADVNEQRRRRSRFSQSLGREREAAVRLGRIGFDHIAGYLDGGLHSLQSRPDLTVETPRWSAGLAAERLAESTSSPPLLVDVRSPREHEQRRIAGSLNLPLNHLPETAGALPKDRQPLVYCAGGYRSSIAASLLQARGFTGVTEIAGGLAAWEAAGQPVQTTPLTQEV